MKNMEEIKNLDQVKNYSIKNKETRRFYSAQHEEILKGLTTDIYFVRTLDILNHMGIADKEVTAEIFARKTGVFVGIKEVINILKDKNVDVWALEEGEEFKSKETLVRIKGSYKDFAIYESIILGCLASPSGWATAATEIKKACGDKDFVCFGTRHLHPAVSPVMERASRIGGAKAVSNILAAKLIDEEPSGTLPHASFLVAGDTIKVAKAYDEIMPQNHKRIVLVDTYKDEVEESLRVADALGENLYAIRLDTPSERGGVTVELVKELRARLDLEGYNWVKIFASGGLTPERIQLLDEAGVDAFGVGSYISGAPAIDMTMDIKEVEGKPVAKRGRIPGITENKRLVKMI